MRLALKHRHRWCLVSAVVSELPTMGAGKLTVLNAFETPVASINRWRELWLVCLYLHGVFFRDTAKGILAESVRSYR